MDNIDDNVNTDAAKAARMAIDGVDSTVENPPHEFFVKVIGEICTLRVHGDEWRISGCIEEVGPENIFLRHKDGRVSIIKISAIDLVSIVPTRHYDDGSVAPMYPARRRY